LNAGASGPWFRDELGVDLVDLREIVHTLQVDIDFNDLVPRGLGSIEHVGKIAQALPSMSLNVPWNGFPCFVYGNLAAEEESPETFTAWEYRGSCGRSVLLIFWIEDMGVNGT